MLLPLALRLASRSSSSTVVRPTGLGRKARTDWRERMASSTAAIAASRGIWFGTSCIGEIQRFQALRDFAQEQPLDVIVRQQIPRYALIGHLSEVHHISTIRNAECMRGFLLNHHDRQTLVTQRQQSLEDDFDI